ncbi:unnamed protein product [Cochlearia groenlandica]
MALSPETLDDLKKLIATQVAEAMSLLLPQQISQQLTLEREKQAQEATKVTSDSDGGSTPNPSEAMRICKGKGIAGTSRFQAIRNLRPNNAEKEQRVPRQRAHAELSEPEDRAPRRRQHAAPRRPTQTIVWQRVYIGSSDEYCDRRRRSQRRERRERDDPRDPESQQLKHIKAKFPPFLGKNDSEAYLDWERKMESSFLCHDTYASNKVKIAISEFTDLEEDDEVTMARFIGGLSRDI